MEGDRKSKRREGGRCREERVVHVYNVEEEVRDEGTGCHAEAPEVLPPNEEACIITGTRGSSVKKGSAKLVSFLWSES